MTKFEEVIKHNLPPSVNLVSIIADRIKKQNMIQSESTTESQPRLLSTKYPEITSDSMNLNFSIDDVIRLSWSSNHDVKRLWRNRILLSVCTKFWSL
jgi:hypothetical protein